MPKQPNFKARSSENYKLGKRVQVLKKAPSGHGSLTNSHNS